VKFFIFTRGRKRGEGKGNGSISSSLWSGEGEVKKEGGSRTLTPWEDVTLGEEEHVLRYESTQGGREKDRCARFCRQTTTMTRHFHKEPSISSLSLRDSPRIEDWLIHPLYSQRGGEKVEKAALFPPPTIDGVFAERLGRRKMLRSRSKSLFSQTVREEGKGGEYINCSSS